MNIGDLVEFHTSAWVFKSANKDYANPGIVLKVEYSPGGKSRFVAEVYWQDGRITREYDSYLRMIKKSR
jgi:hypothetical protein